MNMGALPNIVELANLLEQRDSPLASTNSGHDSPDGGR
jgi:hypothetical protein